MLGLEILVDSIAAAIVGLGGETQDRIRIDRPRRHLSVDDVVADLAGLARELRARNDGPIIGIGVAVAGVVRHGDGLVSMAPNLGWVDVPLGARLARGWRSRSRSPSATTRTPGSSPSIAGAPRSASTTPSSCPGEVGVGGGVIVGGRPLIGSSGFAGEIGHMTVNPGGARCRCGGSGCWETEVGEGVLLARAGYPPDAGRAGVDRVLRDADDGSPAALAALDHVGRWLGIGIGGLVNILNPRMIVLGGPHARIALAKAEIARGRDPAVKALAREMIVAYTDELQRLERAIADLQQAA